jgi:TonB dependent receptor/CarboxypepD_reg-like domain/TonB-dependent Receptor Plug Domain
MLSKIYFITKVAFFVAISFSLFSQDFGTIRGYIKDANNKEDIIGANIYIEGIAKGASADVSGFFSIGKIPVGTYRLKISSVGYKVKFIENVAVMANIVTELTIYTENEALSLAEVKVVGTKLTNTEVSVISEIKAAQQIVSGISAAQIGKTLDRNAAEVVKRVPGVTIFNNRFINIRGLNERYNTVMLNNTFTPSMENDVRSFSFDIIPSNQIDRILVYKSPAAELSGEFAGGVVKIFTKTIPTENNITFDYGTTLRQGTTGNAFSEPQHGSSFNLGFNDGFNDLPAFFPTTALIKQYSGANKNNSALIQAGQMLNNSWKPKTYSATPDQRATITGTFKITGEKIQVGNTTAINFSDARTLFDMTRKDYVYDKFKIGEYTVPNDFRDANYNRSVRLGALHNWAVKFNNNHILEFKNLYNQMANSQFVNRNGFENGQNWKIASSDQIFRGMYTGQMAGKHTLGNTLIDWVIGYNTSYRDQPDYKRNKYNAEGQLLIPVGATQTVNLGRTNIKMNENTKTGGINIIQKIGIAKNEKGEAQKEIEIKAGIFFENKNRNFTARNLGFVKANSNAFNIGIGSLPIEQIFLKENINATSGLQIDEQTNSSDSYIASNSLAAFYASGNYSFTKKVNLIAGLRIENNQQKLSSNKLTGEPIEYNNKINSLLPSVNLTYNFNEKTLLRLAFGNTINRPEFREIAPFSFYDFVNNRVIIGNEELKNAEISNFDLRYEFYPTPSEVVSIAGFYKNFKNPIEIIFDDPSNPDLTFNNAEKAFSAGVEFELRKSFDKLPNNFLNKFNIVFNSAFIYSRVKLDKSVASTQSDNRPLQGQSPYIINLGLNYQDSKKSLQIGFQYNIIGKRIYAVGSNFGTVYPDWYEMPRNVVDIIFSKGIGKKLIIKGGINDLLNQTNNILQDGNLDGKSDSKIDQVIQSYKPGTTYSIGLSYTIFNRK